MIQSGSQRRLLGTDQRFRQRQVADDAHQDVVDVVGKTAGEHADRLQVRRLRAFMLGPGDMTDVARTQTARHVPP